MYDLVVYYIIQIVMIIRLGYVAMTLNLVDCSPSGTVTATNLIKLPDWDAQLYRLRKITAKNLRNTLRILQYNKVFNIKVYRLTSKLVPLSTHPLTEEWDYIKEFETEFDEIGKFIKENDLRISAHPDHYTLINSSSKKVLDNSLNDLDYHVKVYEAMGLFDYKYKLVIHIGGIYKDKQNSLERFKENFIKLPNRISKRIILENDDKSYTAKDVLELCRDLSIPMVMDIHHHNCVNSGESMEELLPQVFDTWKNEYFNPKVHFSSPKSCRDFRSHADNIDINEFNDFLNIAKIADQDFDVMLEAKNKDTALLNLSKQLTGLSGVKKVSDSEFRIR